MNETKMSNNFLENLPNFDPPERKLHDRTDATLESLTFQRWEDTLFGSGSEWPKDQALPLTIVSYSKNKNKIKIDNRKKYQVKENGGHGQSSQSADFWKIAKMALFTPCMKFKLFLGQMTLFEGYRIVIYKLYSQNASGSVQVVIQVPKKWLD